MKGGKLVISLDFELFWGVRDRRTLEEYGPHIKKVWEVIPRMIELFDKYQVSATFATVGFLFAKDKAELLESIPKILPEYENSNLSPYNSYLDSLDLESPKYHFATPLLTLLKGTSHEISSHTFSHYYCLEEGQTVDSFVADLDAAHRIAKQNGIKLTSIVFPRNQYNNSYIKSCQLSGIIAYRGNEDFWFYKSEANEDEGYIKRAFRLLDSYVNISGYHTYNLETINPKNARIVNIPASRFLRPYFSPLGFLEHLKYRRIKNSMTYAAEKGEIYHLWWHPHNFGSNTEQNFKALESILEHYKELNGEYDYKSSTMSECAREFLEQNA